MFTRLQVALGSTAIIRGEVTADGPRRRFAAHGPDDSPTSPPTRLVVLHPPPPEGPAVGSLLDRMASIQAVGHLTVASPLATGEFEGCAWSVEPVPDKPTIAERLYAGERLSVNEVIRIMREITRALAALHRRGIVHGALTPDAVTSSAGAVMLHRLATRHDGSSQEDLHDLAHLAWLALTGRSPEAALAPLSQLRPTVPGDLEALIGSLLDPDPKSRPQSAAAVLEALDILPIPEPSHLKNLLDGAGRGARTPMEKSFVRIAFLVIVLSVVGALILKSL